MAEVVIIGSGAVGVNAALFLGKLGLDVELIDSAPDILQGAPQASFINHGDGFEYYKLGHRRTGEYCIDGSIVKGLIYPLAALQTSVTSRDNPIRFLLAEKAVNENGLTLRGFNENAEHMCRHFTRQFEAVKAARGLSDDDAEKLFLRHPRYFWRRLRRDEYADTSNVAGGCAGSSFGINMPHYYALLKAALRQLRVPLHLGVGTEAIERRRGGYVVHAGGKSFTAGQILLTSSHQIPRLVSKIRGASCAPHAPGTYYLNSITFLKLPATRDAERLAHARRINFTLQQEHGSMYACVVAPTETEDGLAATYYPSPRGSQLRSISSAPDDKTPLHAEWDRLIETGLPNDHPNVSKTFEQACSLYPFLRDYAEVSATICRSVFNTATLDNNGGLDRRVREIAGPVNNITDDGRVTAWTAPKWTNAELTALMAADYVCGLSSMRRTSAGPACRFGPTGLDVVEIARRVQFFDVKMNPSDAYLYAARQGVPHRVVNAGLPQFAPQPDSSAERRLAVKMG